MCASKSVDSSNGVNINDMSKIEDANINSLNIDEEWNKVFFFF